MKRFWLLPSALTQCGASVSLSILFRSIQDLNSVERKEGDVMALLSMFGESLHLCTVQTERAKYFGPSFTASAISIECINFYVCFRPFAILRSESFKASKGSQAIGIWILEYTVEAFSDRTLL